MNDRFQCRLCAEFKSVDDLLHINQEESINLNLEHKIQECLNLNFDDNSLTKYVCVPCSEKVFSSFDFQEQVKKAQSLLQVSPPEDKTNIKEEFSDFDNHPLDYVQSLLNDSEYIKKEDSCFDSNDENRDDVTSSSSQKGKGKKKRGRKKKLSLEKKESKRRSVKYEKKPNLSLDPDKAIDSAERSQIIRRVKDEWKVYKWKCSQCQEELPSVEDLRTHFSDAHQRSPQYSCMECSKVYDSYYSFKRHHRKHRKEFNYRCQICSRFFYLKKQYETHLTTHDPENVIKVEKKHVCPTCGKHYKTSSSLRGHLHTYHVAKRKYKCETCNKILNSKANVHYHQKIHKGDRDFTCEQCGKNFLKASNLKYHMRSAHSDDKPYCCPHCQRTFKIEQLLKTHLQVHSTEKRHACEVCGKRFHRKGTLTRHSTVHTGVLAFECDYCKKKFRTKQLLKVHVRQHTGERPYCCVECNHHFTDSSNYVKHMKGKHGVLTTRKDATYRTDPPPQQQQQQQQQQQHQEQSPPPPLQIAQSMVPIQQSIPTLQQDIINQTRPNLIMQFTQG